MSTTKTKINKHNSYRSSFIDLVKHFFFFLRDSFIIFWCISIDYILCEGRIGHHVLSLSHQYTICMGGKGRRDVTHRSYNEYTRRVYTDHHINIHLFTCSYSFTMCISNNRLSCEHKARRREEEKKWEQRLNTCVICIWKENVLFIQIWNAHFL